MFRKAKREAGENPARYRRCKRGAWVDALRRAVCHWQVCREGRTDAQIREPEDLHERAQQSAHGYGHCSKQKEKQKKRSVMAVFFIISFGVLRTGKERHES